MSFLDRFKRKQKQEPPPAPVPGLTTAAGAPAKGPAKMPMMGEVIAAKEAPPADEIRLELGDFLHRIPAQLLLPGPHDLKAELRFEIPALSARIAQGITMVNLAEIYRRVPQIFRSEVLEADGVEIRFPWQKIAKLVTSAKGAAGIGDNGGTPSALAEKLRAKKPAKYGTGTPPPAQTGRVLPGLSLIHISEPTRPY